jgi:hypothetical protein
MTLQLGLRTPAAIEKPRPEPGGFHGITGSIIPMLFGPTLAVT